MQNGEALSTSDAVACIAQNSNSSKESSKNLARNLQQNTDFDSNESNAAEKVFQKFQILLSRTLQALN